MLGLFVVCAVLVLISGDGSTSNTKQENSISSGPQIYSRQSININGVPYAEPVKFEGAGGLNGYKVGLANGGSIITGHASYVGTRGDPLLAEALQISDYGIGSISGLSKSISTTSGDDDSSKTISVQQSVKAEPRKVVIPEPRPEVQYHVAPIAVPERSWVPRPEVNFIAEPEPVHSPVISVRPEAYKHIIHSYDNTNLHVPVAEHTVHPEPIIHGFSGYSPELYSTKVYHPIGSLRPVRLLPLPLLHRHRLLNQFTIHRQPATY